MREVILVKFLWQDNSLFLFEMVCFKTTTEKKDFMIGKVMLCGAIVKHESESKRHVDGLIEWRFA